MRNEEKNTKRLWRRGSVLDIVIVLLLVAAIVSVGYRYYKNREAALSAQTETVMLTVRAEGVTAAIPSLVRLAETVYWNETNEVLGEIVSHPHAASGTPLSVSESRDVVGDGQGNLVDTVIPEAGLKDIEGVIRCQGSMDGTTFLWNGKTPITKGQQIVIHTEYVALTVTVVGIEAQEAQ
jgi:hypothetical protein